MTLAKQGGRIGLLVPSGLATDHHAAPLRRRLLESAELESLTGFDNRRAIFPIHRSVRFVICSATNGSTTREIRCRFGIDDPLLLETIPDEGDIGTEPAYPVSMTPAFIHAVSGENMTIPELRLAADVEILDQVARRFRRLRDPSGWNVRFGRELNATDDRPHFHRGRRGLVVLEGKHIEPFRVQLERAGTRINASTAARLLDSSRTFGRVRLAYRDVASKTNRLSLIAALLPANVVTTHSLFCLKTEMSEQRQVFLCGVLNSFVANYLVRQVMTTHLGSTTVEQLRAPEMGESKENDEIVYLTRQLGVRSSAEHVARLQALVARAYELTYEHFERVLETFPLVPLAERTAALDMFKRLS